MLQAAEVFHDQASIQHGIDVAADRGYAFVGNALTDSALGALSAEAAQLDLELGDHIAQPIYAGTKRQITQMHERAYYAVDHPAVPVATLVTNALAAQARALRCQPSLTGWRATEAGYQLYRNPHHHISKHRDRRNDQLLAATITIHGAARIGIHEPLGDPDDYTNTRLVDEFRATTGTVMFLRAAGLGTGEQVIHDVSPPEDGPRLILNLRMRPDILPPPKVT